MNLWTSVVLVRRNALGDQRFDPGVQVAEDRDLWIRPTASTAIYLLPEPLATDVQLKPPCRTAIPIGTAATCKSRAPLRGASWRKGNPETRSHRLSPLGRVSPSSRNATIRHNTCRAQASDSANITPSLVGNVQIASTIGTPIALMRNLPEVHSLRQPAYYASVGTPRTLSRPNRPQTSSQGRCRNHAPSLGTRILDARKRVSEPLEFIYELTKP